MLRKINPMVDIVFKAIFGAEERKDLLMDFLNCIFSKIGLSLITSLSIDNPYSGRDRLKDREIILDVKVTDESGRVIQIEMQANPYTQITKRMIYNNATITYKTLKIGDNFYKVGEVISIWVLGKNLDNLQQGIDLIELKSLLGRKHFDLQKIVILEADKLSNRDDRIGRWMYIINKWEEYSLNHPPKWMLEDAFFKEVISVMDVFSMNDEEYDLYLARLNYQFDAALRERSGYEDGLKDGRKEGQLSENARMLIMMMNKKFSYSLNDPCDIMKIEKIDILEKMTLALLNAESLNDILSLKEN